MCSSFTFLPKHISNASVSEQRPLQSLPTRRVRPSKMYETEAGRAAIVDFMAAALNAIALFKEAFFFPGKWPALDEGLRRLAPELHGGL